MVNLKSIKMPKQKKAGPAWAGPCGEGPQGGVTSSLLGKFLACRDRFRVLTIVGLKPVEKWEARIGFGNMWHACEEAWNSPQPASWRQKLKEYCEPQLVKFPMQQDEIYAWWMKCQAMFPPYVEHWKKHPDVVAKENLEAEQVFDVPYTLPSGQVVRLRGKRDSVDYVPKGPNQGVWLQENKTKTEVNAQKVEKQLRFDLQTMIYLIALEHDLKEEKPIIGVRYNVVKRSSHKQGKNENADGFCQRLAGLVREEPDEWMGRWDVRISASDIKEFRQWCLDPLLENLVHWYKQLTEPAPHVDDRPYIDLNYRTPYGVYNPLLEGGFGDVDEFLVTGDRTGLRVVDDLFPELANAA